MKSKLSDLRLTLRHMFGLDVRNHARDWVSSPQRNLEAGFAIARALVVLSVPVVIGADGLQGVATLASKPLVAVYSLYAAALILASVTVQRRLAPFIIILMHSADIFWGYAFAASMGGACPVLLWFVFPILAAAFRWGSSAMLVTTLTLVAGVDLFINRTVVGPDGN